MGTPKYCRVLLCDPKPITDRVLAECLSSAEVNSGLEEVHLLPQGKTILIQNLPKSDSILDESPVDQQTVSCKEQMRDRLGS